MRIFSKSETRGAYGQADAARYVRISGAKVRRWADLLANPETPAFPISFANLLQLHLLKAMRVEHRVPLQRVRRALPALRIRYGSNFPLLQEQLLTDGLDLFLRDDADGLINLSNAQQRTIREHFDLYLQRIELKNGVARLYPFVHPDDRPDAPRFVVIDPLVGFGRSTIDGTAIQTSLLAGRFRSGDSIADLMAEYELTPEQFEEAIRWEMYAPADAA